MAVTVDARTPRFRITAWTQRHGTLDQELDSSVIEIVTSKQMGHAAGAWQFTLVPREVRTVNGRRLTWHDLFEPNDAIQIELWVPPNSPTVVMRGFVDAVHEEFQIGGGRPVRYDVVAGRDYGKLALITIPYYPDSVALELDLFRRWEEWRERTFGWGNEGGPCPESMAPAYYKVYFTPTEFIQGIWENLIDPQQTMILEAISGGGAVPTAEFVSEVDEKDPAVGGISTWDPIAHLRIRQPLIDAWTLLTEYQHRPWRELFFEEGNAAPRLVYRPTPWLDRFGQFIQGPTDSVKIRDVDPGPSEMRRSLTRSDRAIANFFLTVAGGGFGTIAEMQLRYPAIFEGIFAGDRLKGNPWLIQPGDAMVSSAYQIHGLRILKVASPYFDLDRKAEDEAIIEAIKTDIARMGLRENKKLVAAFNHMAWLEEGTLGLKGDETLGIGHYLKMTDTGAMYYAEGVAHRFRQATQEQDGHFWTDVQVSRGRGYIERAIPSPSEAP